MTVEIPGGVEKLRAAGMHAAQRGSSVRVGFHLYNTEEDADLAVDVLRS